MDVARWEQIKELFHTALELNAAERAAFLVTACGDDAELRREVELLLSANHQASGFLDSPALQQAAQSLADDKQSTQQFVPAIGQEFSHYKILSRIGAGGMGEVYLARDARLKRRVALKLLPLKFTQDAVRLQRFIREAEAASALNHPNIITIYEIGVAETERGLTHFISTEYIEGATLREWQPEEESKRLIQTLELGSQIASALDAAHQAGIVHRDIKPDNLMVRPDGLVKVLDFGLAKLTATNNSGSKQIDTDAETTPAEMQTLPGLILGTLRYMSPEQARGRLLDARTDIFSLGVVLHELLTGKPLFEGETTADVIAAIIHKEPPPLSTYLPNAPSELERILRKTLAKNCRDRYQTARDLQIDLQGLKQESELSARLARSGQSLAANSGAHVLSKPPGARFRPWQALLIFPFAILLAGTLWWWLVGHRRQVETPLPTLLKTTEVFSWQTMPGEGATFGAFSPDGKWVGFTSSKSGRKSIWVKQATSGDAEQSTKDEFNNQNPIWSPNGEEIAYVSLRGDQVSIWRKPQVGGTPRLIKAFASDESGLQLRSWSRRGETIYYELSANLFALEISSGATKQLTNLGPTKTNQNSLSISPDERHIAYITSSDDVSIVWAVPVSGGTAKQVGQLSATARKTVWHSDSNRIFFSASIEGTYQLFVADLDGHQPVQLTFGERDGRVIDVSADGTKVLYDSSVEESNLWGVNVAKAEELAIASDVDFEFWPDVAPDGRAIAYQSVRNLSQGNKIYQSSILVRSIASIEREVTFVKDGVLPKWAPDGRCLAFMRLQGTELNLWTVNASSKEEKQLVKGRLMLQYTVLPYNRSQTNSFNWSPDSNKLVYSSATNGQYNLWIVTADGSNNTQITNNNDPDLVTHAPSWSKDGRQLAYLVSSDRTSAERKISYGLWVNDLEQKTSKNILQVNSFIRFLGWSQTGQELLFAKGQAGTAFTSLSEISLFRVRVKTGRQDQIASLPNTYLHNIYLSADRRTVAFVSRQDGKDNVWVIPAVGGIARKLTGNTDPRLYVSSLAWSPDNRAIYFGKQTKHNLIAMLTNFR